MIKIKNINDEKITFATDMPISLANAIRRSINYIPILAIDELEISKNDSAVYDEILAHRVGLVPLKNEELKFSDECDCKGKGCGKCTIKLKLKAKGPKIVHSSELSPKTNSILDIPITILDKNQELEFVAIARMGRGKEHAKHSPGILYYKYSDDKLNPDVKKDDEDFKTKIDELTNKITSNS